MRLGNSFSVNTIAHGKSGKCLYEKEPIYKNSMNVFIEKLTEEHEDELLTNTGKTDYKLQVISLFKFTCYNPLKRNNIFQMNYTTSVWTKLIVLLCILERGVAL